jgi:transmembrane sensor
MNGEEQVRAAVAQQAGTWFIANQSGSLGEAERADFVAWLKASPIHVEEYLGVALVAHDLPAAAEDLQMPLESLLELARADHSDGVVHFERSSTMPEPAPRGMRAPRGWSFATSIVATVLLAAVLWWLRGGDHPGPTVYQTAHGEQIAAQLPDGSILHLNSESLVTVRYSRGERVVEVDRGQALFVVARDEHRRFRVAAGDVHIIAVGTRFDVNCRSNSTIVTVVEGTVAMLAAEPPAQTGFPAGALRVDAGLQVLVDSGGVLAQPTAVDVQQTVAWLQKKIAFEQRPLGEVAEEFNRYGSVTVQIEDAALRALPITGVFDAYDVDSFVAFLRTLEGVHVERTDAQIRVLAVK